MASIKLIDRGGYGSDHLPKVKTLQVIHIMDNRQNRID